MERAGEVLWCRNASSAPPARLPKHSLPGGIGPVMVLAWITLLALVAVASASGHAWPREDLELHDCEVVDGALHDAVYYDSWMPTQFVAI